MHRHAHTVTQRCTNVDADMLIFTLTCVHTAACSRPRRPRALTHLCTHHCSVPLGKSSVPVFFPELGAEASCGEGPPVLGGRLLPSCCRQGRRGRAQSPPTRMTAPGRLFGLARRSGCCLVNLIIAAPLLICLTLTTIIYYMHWSSVIIFLLIHKQSTWPGFLLHSQARGLLQPTVAA